MKHAALFAQIATLTMAALSRRPDAMGWAAGFAVLCVVVVLLKSMKFEGRASLTRK